MKHRLTCIVCPVGCAIEAETDGGRVVSVSGNGCRRGEEYAKSEITAPKRVITTTVKTRGARPVPVKTDRAVPKELVLECMREINKIRPDEKNLDIGAVVCKNILNTGADVVVTAPVRRKR